MAIKLLEKDIEAGPYEPIRFSNERRRGCAFVRFLLGSLVSLAALVYLVFSRNTCAFHTFFQLAPVAPIESFEVLPPVASSTLTYNVSDIVFDDVQFASSLSAPYNSPSDFNFTGGYMTLNVTAAPSAESAFSVLEVSVDGVPIWRTATPFPSVDTEVFSSTSKNISEYLSLFEANSTIEISSIEGAGSFALSLEVVLYAEPKSAVAPSKGLAVSDLFSPQGPASHVFALQDKPVKLPESGFVATLPQVASNVTAAKISLFVSASDEEVEFYKSGVSPAGEPLASGPFRQFNLFVSGTYAGTVNPKPTLFHADKLFDGPNPWTPLVDSGTYSGFAYEVDLVALLPLLWEAEQTLEIIVVSPVQAADATPVPPPAHPISSVTNIAAGSWTVSGALLVWESALIQSASGNVVSAESSQLDSGTVVSPPKISPWQPQLTNSKASSTSNSSTISSFHFVLSDNTTSSLNVVANTTSLCFLTRQEMVLSTPVGPPGGGLAKEKTSLSSFALSTTKFKLDVQDPATNLTLYSTSTKTALPLSFRLKGEKDVAGATTASYTGKIETDVKKKVNAIAVSSVKIKEEVSGGDAVDSVVEVSYKKDADYKRKVQSVNGIIISDTAKPIVF
ncbi:Peptide N-acetyl-beta-D-glucosaminyl asparaginase amidase A family protein [Clavispora lusitaniae]|uniref:Peptide N-acetyl-beta-D-glucosaminyl asparaginase amidase A family protein n=1 Tax=Clavispora lusitaniae TaxID=36911 RepID=UPI00202BEBA0|nr:Peptide N-acetyl-beta-D-glucosaminyl asparaginase amidase A family protein [Clavispora lusitaniae]